MPRRVVLVIVTVGLIALSACGLVTTSQGAHGGAQPIAAPAAAPAHDTTSSGRVPAGVAPTDKNTAEQSRAPVAPSPAGTIGSPSTSGLPAKSGGGTETFAGDLSGGDCTGSPFLHCYKK